MKPSSGHRLLLTAILACAVAAGQKPISQAGVDIWALGLPLAEASVKMSW